MDGRALLDQTFAYNDRVAHAAFDEHFLATSTIKKYTTNKDASQNREGQLAKYLSPCFSFSPVAAGSRRYKRLPFADRDDHCHEIL